MRASAFLKEDLSRYDSRLLLLIGEEAELRQSVINAVCKHILTEDKMGLEVLDARSDSTSALIDVVASGGLFASERVIIYKNAQDWNVAAKSADLIELQRVLDRLDQSTWVLIAAESANRAQYPFKYLVKAGEIIECDRIKGGELVAWAQKELNAMGLTASPAVLSYAIDTVGNDLLTIRNTLEKISLYLGERTEIAREDVTACVATAREHAMWELTELIGKRDVSNALAMTDKLLHEGKHPLQISATLQFQFRQLIAVRSLLQQGKSARDIQQELNIRFFVERIISQSKAFKPSELLAAYQRLYALEDSLKSASADERFILEKTIYDICSAA